MGGLVLFPQTPYQERALLPSCFPPELHPHRSSNLDPRKEEKAFSSGGDSS